MICLSPPLDVKFKYSSRRGNNASRPGTDPQQSISHRQASRTGGFGAVNKSWNITLDRTCALKESFELSPEGQRQFLREAQILAKLTHPNLPRVTDFFTIPGQGQYLVMDFVEGQDLEELRIAAGGRLPESQVLPRIAQVCDALDYLHSQTPPVIHTDIKPARFTPHKPSCPLCPL